MLRSAPIGRASIVTSCSISSASSLSSLANCGISVSNCLALVSLSAGSATSCSNSPETVSPSGLMRLTLPSSTWVRKMGE